MRIKGHTPKDGGSSLPLIKSLTVNVMRPFLDKKSILASICLITWGSGADVTGSRSFHRKFDVEAADVRSPYQRSPPEN